MTIQQRMHLLQILYEERAKGSQTCEREILTQRMNTIWDNFRHEVAYSEENGYIEVKRRHIGSRIFEGLRITAKGIDLIESSLMFKAPQSHIDVLLVTVTDIEAATVLKAFPEAKLCHLGNQAYHDLGVMRGAKIFMVQSEMGSGGQSGAILTIQEAIDTLHPSAVIMVGIAFGMDEKKQQLGDILISKQIQPYDLQRVGTDRRGKMAITLRSDRPSASPRMLSIFRGAANYWQTPPKIHFGLLLSGDKVIANQAFRDQLASLGPGAIGGEMEGAGLYAAAQRKKVDWILVKAVCDWADGGKNDVYQQLAAENAVRFLVHVLEKGGFAASRVGGFQANVVDNSSHIDVINRTEPSGSSLRENAEKRSAASGLQESAVPGQRKPIQNRPIRLSQQDRRALVQSLLACPCVSDNGAREAVIRQLPQQISSALIRSQRQDIDVQNIVDTCLNYAGGLKTLVNIVRSYDDGTWQMREFDELLHGISPKLLES